MSSRLLARVGLSLWLAATCLLARDVRGQESDTSERRAESIQPDFGNIRGLNYIASYAPSDVAMWRYYDSSVIDRELAYVRGLGANSVRVWLAWIVYDVEGEAFVGKFRDFLQLCEKHQLTVMPILWDSCFGDDVAEYDDVRDWVANPGTEHVADPEFRARGNAYVRAVVEAGRMSPSLLIWDIMNEPSGPGIHPWLEHYCQLVKSLDPAHPRTIGWAHAGGNQRSAEWVDVMSYHPYGIFDKNRQKWTEEIRTIARRHHKPFLATEAGAPGWGQRYEECLEFFQREKTGFYLFEAMVGTNRFRDMQGFFYPDGTIREMVSARAFQACAKRQGITGLSELTASDRPLPYLRAGAAQVAEMVSHWDALELTPQNFAQHEAMLRWTLISLAWGGALGDHIQQIQAWKAEADAAQKTGDMETVRRMTSNMARLAAELLVEHGFVEDPEAP